MEKIKKDEVELKKKKKAQKVQEAAKNENESKKEKIRLLREQLKRMKNPNAVKIPYGKKKKRRNSRDERNGRNSRDERNGRNGRDGRRKVNRRNGNSKLKRRKSPEGRRKKEKVVSRVKIMRKKDYARYKVKNKLKTEKKKKKKRMPDYDGMEDFEKAKSRAKFRIKLEDLRAKWKDYDIPDYSSDDLRMQHAEYYTYCDQLLKTVVSSQYKNMLIIFWIIMEFVGTKFLKLNLTNFTDSQLKNFGMYDYLLTKLGKKSKISIGKGLPIPVKIIGYSALNIVIFVILNYIAKLAGPSAVQMIDKLLRGALVPEKKGAGQEDEDIMDAPELPSTFIETVASNVSGITSMFSNNGNKSSNNAASNNRPRRGPRFSD